MAQGINKQVLQVGGVSGGTGDMLKSVYDVNDSGYVDSTHKILLPFINKLGSTLTKGTIVYLKSSSSSTNFPEALKANASTEETSSKTIGAIYEDTINDATGYIVTNGEVHNLDTSAYSVGTSLWLSTTDGQVTTTRPTAPNHAVYIGKVTRSQATNGRIHYSIMNGYELEELHDVSFTGLANDDFVQRKGGLWTNRTIAQVKTDLGIATDISNAISGLVDTAPATLDTLNELANALGDDPNFATTITTSLGNKVDKIVGKGLSTEDYTTLEKTKLGFIAVTQAVDLDQIESDTATNNAKVSNATHTGDVTGATALTITNDAVTNAKLSNMANATIKGRATAGTGDPEDLTASQVRTIINVADGANNYIHPNHTGDVTSTGDGATVIANNAVTLAKMADVATGTLFYRKTAGTGDPETQTLATLKTDLGLTGTNSGDQTSIVGITGTKAQFNTAVTDGDFMYVGDAPTAHTHTTTDITNLSSYTGLDVRYYTETETDSLLSGKANTSHTHTLANVTDVTMTVANLNSLDDGVNSTLHFHNTDRDRANHTGTQTASTISDFNESIQDMLSTFIVQGANMTITYDDVANTMTFSSTGGVGGGLTYPQILAITSLRI